MIPYIPYSIPLDGKGMEHHREFNQFSHSIPHQLPNPALLPRELERVWLHNPPCQTSLEQ